MSVNSCIKLYISVLCTWSVLTTTIASGSEHSVPYKGHLPQPELQGHSAHTDSGHGQGSVYIPWQAIDQTCLAFVEAMARSAANFVECSVRHARPLHFCQSCIDDYVHVQSAYKAIAEDDIKDSTGSTCKDVLLSRDRIQVVKKTWSFVDDMWSKGYCSSCFSSYKDVNGTVEKESSHGAHEFEILFQEVASCVSNVTGGGISPYNHTSKGGALVCTKCLDSYNKLNKHYAHIEHETHNHVCVDLVDAMNYTRIMWSDQFHCTVKSRDLIPVICLTVFFSLLPIVFYIGSKIHGVKQERKIIKQKRLNSSS
ncbi:unnamed protein product [Owenia fusiformis]|uniref:Uncharacterized protein n=1 Tax=Owenia fusiformis TaxID=6347 RepID=A0A8J1TBK9_OWEFU|nr:unnamed protein product [Owenia fusiformis]